MMSPPLDMAEKWFAPHTAYTMAKFGMSMVVLGLAGELRPQGIAVNALWPRTTIATAAVKNLLGGEEVMRRSRRPDIVADAAYRIFAKPARSFSGQFLIDDTFLAAEGVADFEQYRVDPNGPLAPDFFVPDHIEPPPGVIVPPRPDVPLFMLWLDAQGVPCPVVSSPSAGMNTLSRAVMLLSARPSLSGDVVHPSTNTLWLTTQPWPPHAPTE
jgi:hypothetical protein